MKNSFGLPLKLNIVKLLTNQKPFSVDESKNFKGQKNGLKFKNGICAACQYSENKSNGEIDLIKKIIKKFIR